MCEGKALDKLRYHKIKMKCIKIKDARIRNNKIFQEDQGMFYRKTQGTKQLKGKVPKMERVLGRNLGRQHQNPMTKMDEDGCKENRIKIYECAGIDNHRKEVKRKNWSAPRINGVENFLWKKFRGTCSAILRCFNQWLEQPDEIPDWLTQGRIVLTPKTKDLSNERKLSTNYLFLLVITITARYLRA